MSRFARIEEEAIKYQSELTGEELRLYVLIKFHTWSASGICNKNLTELAQIYGLVYNHTTERYKSLRKKGWCENTKHGIRPIIELKTSFFESGKTPKIGVGETPEYGVIEDTKLQKSEPQTPEYGVIEDTKLQKSEFPFKRNIEPFKDENFIDTTHDEKTAGVSVKNGTNLSKFSLSECLRYTELCRTKGDEIRNPRALAITLHKSGESDAFIEAALYPEQPEQTVEYDDDTPDGVPRRLSAQEREDSMRTLIEFRRLNIEFAEDEKFYAPEDWAWLMEQLEVYE